MYGETCFAVRYWCSVGLGSAFAGQRRHSDSGKGWDFNIGVSTMQKDIIEG
jgi:hypothetical protein